MRGILLAEVASVVRRPIVVVLASLFGALPSCYDAHLRAPPPAEVPCDLSPPRCARRASPCDALALVEPICAGDVWACPDGAEPFVAPWADEVCLPLLGELPLHADGVHEAPVSVPMGGRCAWVFPSAADGTSLAATFPGDRCAALEPPVPVATRGEGFDHLALQASFVDATGASRVVARGWALDASAPFGVRSLGVGFGRVLGATIESAPRWLFDDALDLGDAAVVDGGLLYAYGCPGEPHWLEEDCIVGRAPLPRIDEPEAWSVLGERGWGEGAPARVFGSGPHRGAVVRDPLGGFLHLYAIGFGVAIEATHAERPEGPWSPPATLVSCALPTDDPDAYCAGPGVYLELHDPTRPRELVIGYSIGTTAPDGLERRARDPAAYWPRVVRVRR